MSVLCDNESVLCDNESVLCDSESVVLCNSESIVLCDNQSVVFSSNSDSVVNDTVDCANDYSVAESDFVCPVCLKTFTNKYNLKRHANKLHSSNIALIESLKTNRSQSFNCEYCHLKFSSQKNLKHHLNKIHTSSNSQTGNYTCPLCYGKFEKQEIIFHFKNAHDIDMNHIELEFNSFNDYLAWKAEIENCTKSKFVSYGSKHINTHGVKCYYFRCHRSGNFVSDSKGLRYLKILGSNKINAYCPAALKVTQHTDGKCVVSYQNVHIGHQNDIGHLFLTAGERKIIASKIAAKIPLDNILDEIRNSISDAGLERVHLLTKKDLHNIEKSFNLSSNAVKHENDGASVDMWVREMQNSENPCILFYKTQGSSCIQHPFLKENDFVLIIMTEAQGEILKEFSSDCVCIDGTHGVNGYGFELITLLTIDDLRQGFPCAFLISNRCDQPVLSIFFSYIKEKVGPLQPQVFMSDMAESFLNAWNSEMGLPQKRLFCATAYRQSLEKIFLKKSVVLKSRQIHIKLLDHS
ncbi:uncharacterized protein TNCT_193011 [Trichonephila clavata]|uniref:C2H2-type domain-containing protein n=1 Tax=Trichonephila clavata TaxID=2740835 RepID=A0A8X6F4K9_TRICU|nr:uncharacterized protein TNCT_193011 [Trichonephila clavata]